MKKGFTSPLLFWPVLACAVLSPLHAASPDLRDLLRDGLYKEEVNRDPEGAAKTYQDLLARNDEQRDFAATAQFRLAEVRRKQGHKDEAIEAYRQLLIRYPEAETECRIARENLAAMGVTAPATEGAPQAPSPATPEDGDEAFLATLKDIQTKAPDTLGNKENFDKAITQGYSKSVSFLLKNAPPSSQTPVLTMAVEAGSLEMVKLIYANGMKPNADENRMLLALAAAKNQFFIAQELLKQGIDVNGVPEQAADGLPPSSIAVAERTHESLAKYLPGTALTTAIAFGNPKLIELILQANPDVNSRNPEHGYSPLVLAVSQRNPALVKELLARKADPNLTGNLPMTDVLRDVTRNLSNSRSWNPLDVAVALDEAEIARLLVQSGGTLQNQFLLFNNEQLPPPLRQEGAGQRRIEEDPDDSKATFNPWVRTLIEDGLKLSDFPDLGYLVSYASKDELKFLLDKGLNASALADFDPYSLSSGKLKLLLEHGLDPNQKVKKTSLLLAMVWAGHVESTKVLLEMGARISSPDEEGQNLLYLAAAAGFPDGILNTLIDHGASMPEEWFETEAYASQDKSQQNRQPRRIPSGAVQFPLTPSARIRTLLFQRLLLPRLKSSPDIRVVMQTPTGTVLDVLESKSPSQHPESLESILERKQKNIPWHIRADTSAGPSKVTIWHTNSDGQRTSQTASLLDDKAFPGLEWGDVVEFSYAPADQEIFGKLTESRDDNHTLPDDLIWKMRQRISFPVSVEMDDQAQELTMTGSLVTFDPTQQKIPLMGAAQLARLISQKKPDRYFADTVTVIRQGWPEVRLLTTSDPSADFPLQKGDRIQWKTQDKSSGPVYMTSGAEIRVYSPGLPFVARFTDRNMGSPALSGSPTDAPAPRSAPRPTQPSLLQALATLYSPYNRMLEEAPDDPTQLAAWMPKDLQGEVISLLPHPDLANILIHRKGADGAEEVIKVDLQKAADGITPDGTSEQARNADVLLKPGDSVELPVMKDLATPWTGFSSSQRRLMELALSGSIQILQNGSPLQMIPLSYRTPRIVQTPGGLVPLPATEGTSSLLASDLLGNDLQNASNKDGKFYGMEATSIFLSERFQYVRSQAAPLPTPLQPYHPRAEGRR